MNGTINGDLLTVGGNVTVSGTIQNDVRAAGGNLTFSEANIGGNITAGGGNVVIDKATQIQGSLVAGGGNLKILSPIGRGATIGAGSALIGNDIGGNVTAGVGELSLTNEASINGDLTYWSENEVNIAEGTSVSGTIKQEMPEKNYDKEEAGKAAGAAIVGFFFTLKLIDALWLLIVGLAVIFFLPNYSIRAAGFVKGKFGWALLIGFLTVIILPIFGILLAITVIGIPFALVLFFAYVLIMWFGRIFAIYSLGRFAVSKTGNKWAPAWSYIAGLIIYFILTLIPIVNFFTDLLIGLSGIGAFLAMKKEYYQELRQKKLL